MVLRCPKCNEELEIPDKCVGWKVQCIYCNEKFLAAEEFIRKQREAMKRKTCRLKAVVRKTATASAGNTAASVGGKSVGTTSTGIVYEKPSLLLTIVATLTLPIWIVPIVIWYIIKSWIDDDGGGLDLVERERVQWLYGTGRYANKD